MNGLGRCIPLFQDIFQVLTVDVSEIRLTTWDVWNPKNNGINYLPTDAGFFSVRVVCQFQDSCFLKPMICTLTLFQVTMNKGPMVVCWVYRGWNTTQFWGNYFNKPWNQDPVFFNNQDSIHRVFFFRGSSGFTIEWSSQMLAAAIF